MHFGRNFASVLIILDHFRGVGRRDSADLGKFWVTVARPEVRARGLPSCKGDPVDGSSNRQREWTSSTLHW